MTVAVEETESVAVPLVAEAVPVAEAEERTESADPVTVAEAEAEYEESALAQ